MLYFCQILNVTNFVGGAPRCRWRGTVKGTTGDGAFPLLLLGAVHGTTGDADGACFLPVLLLPLLALALLVLRRLNATQKY